MRMARSVCFPAVLIMVFVSAGVLAKMSQGKLSEKILVNQDVIDMLKSGLSSEIVAAKIKTSHCNFSTDSDSLKQLKDKGVPDTVVLAMVEVPHYTVAPDDGKIRVFVTDSQSWEVRGGWGAADGSGGGVTEGGARPQTAEIIKTFSARCPQVTVTNKQDMANYAVTLDHEGGKSLISKDNKVAVFKQSGDAILSKSTRELGSAVKDACAAILADVGSK